jgi:glycosyltransferase involved in cell wall biosynthesis
MNLGIFSLGTGYKEASGMGSFLIEMIRRLSERHNIHLITSGSGQLRTEIENLDIRVKSVFTIRKSTPLSRCATRLRLKPAEVETISALPRLCSIKRYAERELDVLTTHYYLDNMILSNIINIPVVFRFAGIKQPSVRWTSMARVGTPRMYLANSEATADRLRRWLDLDVDGVVYPGVDISRFRPDADPAFKCPQVSILYVGRLDEGKGLYDLLEAQSRLTEDTHLLLVGSGTLEDDLRDRANELGITDIVTFVGAVPHDKIHQYYAAADIFCLPSHHESFGMVNIEAMACGCPVVSTHIDAIEEYLTDEKNGLLVNPGDQSGLTAAIARLAADRDLREGLGSAATETASRFDWKTQANQFEMYLSNVR